MEVAKRKKKALHPPVPRVRRLREETVRKREQTRREKEAPDEEDLFKAVNPRPQTHPSGLCCTVVRLTPLHPKMVVHLETVAEDEKSVAKDEMELSSTHKADVISAAAREAMAAQQQDSDGEDQAQDFLTCSCRF